MKEYLLLKNGDVKISTTKMDNGHFSRGLDSDPISALTFIKNEDIVMVDTNIHVINFYKQKLLNSYRKDLYWY